MDEENNLERYESGQRSLERPRSYVPARFDTIEMEEAPDLRAYWRILWKRRWTILIIFFVLFTVVLIGTLKQTPVYRAKTLVEIQKENPEIVSVQEMFELESVSDIYLETQYRILESRTLARRVIDALKLYRLEEFNPPPGLLGRLLSSGEEEEEAEPETQVFAVDEASVSVDQETYQTALEIFEDRLEIEPTKRSRLVEVSFESEDPELAAQIVNTLASDYTEWNLEARWEATQKATEWLSEQLVGVKGKLEKAEEDLQDYARRNNLLFLETGEGQSENIVNERLRALQEELTKAQAARYEKEALYRLVEEGNYGALPGVVDNELLQDLTIRLAELKREYADLATNFTPEYPKVKQLRNQITEIESLLEEERTRIAEKIRNDYLAAVQREEFLKQAFEEQEQQAGVVARQSVQYNILRREVETNRQLYEGLLQRLKEAGVSAGLKASNIRIVDPAQPPQGPSKPKPLLNLALAVILGLGLGVGAAFLQEYLDNTLKTYEDVERHVQVPTLGLVPSVESLNGYRGVIYGLLPSARKASKEQTSPTSISHWYRIDVEGQSRSALIEAFRSLRTSVLLSTPKGAPRTLLVSSAQPGEGKTTITINLGISLAQTGKRVLLVDTDMRRPCIHKAFALDGHGGVVAYLAGQEEDWRAALQSTPVAGLQVVPCGPMPPNPAELLSTDRIERLIREALEEYDFILFDSPPVLNVADSRILAAKVQGTVLVVKGGATPRELVQRANAHARDVGGNVIGVVLNNLDIRSEDAYYRYYRYDYYGPREGDPPEAS